MNQKITKTLKTNIQDVNEGKGIVTIQITQFDKFDSDNDRLLTGALTKTWSESKQYHLADHKLGTSTFVGLPIKKDAEKGIVESQLNLNKQIAVDLFEDYKFTQKNGVTLEHSHGFAAIKDRYTKNDKGGYDFAEVKQYEYSTVLFGAVNETPLHSIKNQNTIDDLIVELELKLRTCSYSEEYGRLIENEIKELKSMIIEPSPDTLSKTNAAGAPSNKFTFVKLKSN